MPQSAFTDAYAIMRETLVALRKERGITQVELARRLGRSQQFVSLSETGVRRLDMVEFYAFVRALDADPEEVFARIVRRWPKEVRI